MPIKNLQGQRFGRLQVLQRDETKHGGAAYWICQCDCGTVKSIRGSNLTSTTRPTLSCGCINKEVNSAKRDLSSLVGKQFGRLTVLSRDLSKPQGKGCSGYWICQCSCGKICSIMTSQLTSGSTQSCGCLRSELRTQANTKDITNQRFGLVVAKECLSVKNKHQSYLWRCECDCGNTNYICSTENLLSGKIHSCGCNHRSMGEQIIAEILQKNNIDFSTEETFPNLIGISGAKLRFDFVIYNASHDIQLIVEFDGEQHYKKNSYYYNDKLLIHDEIKNQWCKDHDIPLKRIPYTELDNLSLEMIMGDKYLL